MPVVGRVDGDLDCVREAMLASPGGVKDLTLGRRPRNDVHLMKLRLLLKSPSLATLTVDDLTWLAGEVISTQLSELHLSVEMLYANTDIWAMWRPAPPVPNNITQLRVYAKNRPYGSMFVDDVPVFTTYLADASACFQLFDKLEDVFFTPPPSDESWASASDLALSRLREMQLVERGRYSERDVNHLCSRHFVNHAARFVNLVKVDLARSCDVLGPLAELGSVLPSLQVLSLKWGRVSMDYETWIRLTAVLPALRRLEMALLPNEERSWDEFVFKELLPTGFTNLRVIDLQYLGVSLETCLLMTVGVLRHRPEGHVSVRCSDHFYDVSATASTLLDSLRMNPLLRVSTDPHHVDEVDELNNFSVER
jgi:hypothetical protein